VVDPVIFTRYLLSQVIKIQLIYGDTDDVRLFK